MTRLEDGLDFYVVLPKPVAAAANLPVGTSSLLFLSKKKVDPAPSKLTLASSQLLTEPSAETIVYAFRKASGYGDEPWAVNEFFGGEHP